MPEKPPGPMMFLFASTVVAEVVTPTPGALHLMPNIQYEWANHTSTAQHFTLRSRRLTLHPTPYTLPPYHPTSLTTLHTLHPTYTPHRT